MQSLSWHYQVSQKIISKYVLFELVVSALPKPLNFDNLNFFLHERISFQVNILQKIKSYLLDITIF
jgi:hypothetical protein